MLLYQKQGPPATTCKGTNAAADSKNEKQCSVGITNLGTPGIHVVLRVVIVRMLRVYKWIKLVVLRQPIPNEVGLCGGSVNRRQDCGA